MWRGRPLALGRDYRRRSLGSRSTDSSSPTSPITGRCRLRWCGSPSTGRRFATPSGRTPWTSCTAPSITPGCRPTSVRCCSRATARRPRTAAGHSAAAGISASAVAPDTPTRTGEDASVGRSRGARPAAHPGGATPDPVHAQSGDRVGQRLGGRRRTQPARGVRSHPGQRRTRPVQADRRGRRIVRRWLRVGLSGPAGGPEVRPRDLLPGRDLLRGGGAPDGHGQPRRPARRAGTRPAWSGAGASAPRVRPLSGC